MPWQENETRISNLNDNGSDSDSLRRLLGESAGALLESLREGRNEFPVPDRNSVEKLERAGTLLGLSIVAENNREEQNQDRPDKSGEPVLRPVKDREEITRAVPGAVYISSEFIENGIGKHRDKNCADQVQEYWLSKPAADAFMKAQAYLKEQGKPLIKLNDMNGAGRTAMDQKLIHICAPRQVHAIGHSTHQDGISIDIVNHANADVRKALAKFGFRQNVRGDAPHFTYYGPR